MRTAVTIGFTSRLRATELPSSCAWRLAEALSQAIIVTVSTTLTPLACARLMTSVMRELVQPAQPLVGLPMGPLTRLPSMLAFTLK